MAEDFKCWGIFPHSVDKQPTGRGFVARKISCSTQEAFDIRNYGGLRPLKVYKRESAANADAGRRG